MEIQLKGNKNRTERSIPIWKEMYEKHSKEKWSVSFIATQFKRPDGKQYTRSGVYKAFKRLKELGV